MNLKSATQLAIGGVSVSLGLTVINHVHRLIVYSGMPVTAHFYLLPTLLLHASLLVFLIALNRQPWLTRDTGNA